MTQVNLLPVEVRQRHRTRRITALVVSAALAAIGILFLILVLQSARLSKVREELAAQEQVNQRLQGQIADLQQFSELKAELSAKRALLAEAERGEILWSGVLRDVSMLIPADMWLSSLSASVTPQSPGVPATATDPNLGPQLVATLQFDGVAFDQPTIARWLNRLEKVGGWENSWLSSSTKQEGVVDTYQFTGTLDLTTEATVDGSPS